MRTARSSLISIGSQLTTKYDIFCSKLLNVLFLRCNVPRWEANFGRWQAEQASPDARIVTDCHELQHFKVCYFSDMIIGDAT